MVHSKCAIFKTAPPSLHWHAEQTLGFICKLTKSSFYVTFLIKSQFTVTKTSLYTYDKLYLQIERTVTKVNFRMIFILKSQLPLMTN